MFDLKQILIEKRDENPAPNNNKMQALMAEEMLNILGQYESGSISLKEYRRQMRNVKRNLHNNFRGKTQPVIYTGLGDIVEKALKYPDI